MRFLSALALFLGYSRDFRSTETMRAERDFFQLLIIYVGFFPMPFCIRTYELSVRIT